MKSFEQTPSSFMLERLHEKIMAFDYHKDIVENYENHLIKTTQENQNQQINIIKELKNKKTRSVTLGEKQFQVNIYELI